MTDKQQTSVGVPDDVVAREVPHLPDDPPPAPGLGAAMFLFVTCAIYGGVAALASGAVFTYYLRPLKMPMDLFAHGIFAVLPALIIVVSAPGWWTQVKSRKPDSTRWLATLLPCAVLAGGVAGLWISMSIFPPEDRLETSDFQNKDICQQIGVEDMTDCVRYADTCQRSVLAGENTWAAFDRCVQKRFKKK